MRSIRLGAPSALCLATALAATLLGALPAAAAGGPATPAGPAAAGTTTVTAGAAADRAAEQATWKLTPLLEGGQTLCTQTTLGRWSLVYVVIVGTWSTEIEAGVHSLPPGSDIQTFPPLAPGSNPRTPGGSIRINTAVNVYAPPLPVGTYPAVLWASDGVQTQSIPFEIRAQEERC
ncbi:DUF5980 family protein [Plantactinospora sp. WMMB334]|uniref:DUF5980 family protein n=1 Tax=Plantactinospora sp. WMMB334 TaxID=3404119 RepID=UPI003B9445CD